MSAIKNFFQKKKADAKFKLAGPGHKLTTDSSTPAKTSGSQSAATSRSQSRTVPSQSAMMSGVAAIERIEKYQQHQPSMANRASKLLRAEALKALEEEKVKNAQIAKKEILNIDESTHLSVNGVFFHCPLIGPEILPKNEMAVRIKEFLYEQLEEEQGLTSVLIIHTCNSDKALVQVCIETLTKCLNNLIENPTEEKYYKIRVNTKTFQEKIRPVDGAIDFLLAAGFMERKLPHNDNPEEDFYVMAEDSLNIDNLEILRDALESAEPIRPELDRGVRVLQPSALLEKLELPHEFYNISAEELKREQQLRSEEVEQNLMLKTKAMKQRDAERELRRYRFCLIRIKFPDGIILQGTFKTWEKLSALKDFIKEHLSSVIPFELITGTTQRLKENESTLAELGLIPACIINFCCVDDTRKSETLLKPETMALLSDV